MIYPVTLISLQI
uniref:Uncharacterized protein n=1 Tax=Arundo donax TaxID=35708 RepID=A0A0A9BW95_ARUDO